MQTQTMRLRELTIQYSVRKDLDGQPVVVGRALDRPWDAAAALMTLLQDEPAEVFAILCLTTKHRVIAYHEVSRGTLDSTLVHPREVFTAALLAHAAAIVASHSVPGHRMTIVCPESLCAGVSASAPTSAVRRSKMAHNDTGEQTISSLPVGQRGECPGRSEGSERGRS